ncbi:hypothetical protein B0H19DRAFT_1271437 [Mycena capillaripes]|nr:hypothetical protein B0H19DRAFT_1271437 [Mycena capillaripes]
MELYSRDNFWLSAANRQLNASEFPPESALVTGPRWINVRHPHFIFYLTLTTRTPSSIGIEELEKKMQKADPQAQNAVASSSKPNAKPSKATAKDKEKKQTSKPKKDRKEGSNTKRADADGGESSKKKKGKQRAKAAETQDSDST